MKSQTGSQTALHWFCKNISVVIDLIVDGCKSQTFNEVRRFYNQVRTTLKILEVNTP